MKMDCSRYVHQLASSRYIVAHWDATHQQWMSYNIRGFAYAYSRSLEVLPTLNVMTYARRSSANRAARRIYEM
jgi:hypothetical protein